MHDKRQAERQVREEETLKKIWAFQTNQSAPKVTLMKLTGMPVWIPWYLQAMDLTADISSEYVKCQLVIDLLAV